MKITAQQYARALSELLETSKDQDKTIYDFVSHVYRSGNIGMMEDIMSEYQKMYDLNHDIQMITVYSSRELDKDEKKSLEGLLSKAQIVTAKNPAFIYNVDETITAGMRIVTNGKEVDLTVDKALETFLA